ncbi:hypothetical protein CDQ91_18905 [Sphingopyxis witflariensis]|uniref:Uncharacterized protein n=1 Tax=Sphingopyxis witflariensis TaxID=173675 RepID=A0A246JHT4_9SPHN|nr:hypothetical protein CDQ91_18905 [Sphingopyxis witflariensis]
MSSEVETSIDLKLNLRGISTSLDANGLGWFGCSHLVVNSHPEFVTPDLIRGPRGGRGYGCRIKSGMTMVGECLQRGVGVRFAKQAIAAMAGRAIDL